jgi:arylsulfatase A-like enzyme
MRQGKWKLIYFHKEQTLELYDLQKDIQEENDLSASIPDQLKYMATLMTTEMKNRNARMPVVKKTGRPIPWPDEVVASLQHIYR